MYKIEKFLTDIEGGFKADISGQDERLSFGLGSIDKVTQGIKNSELILIAGRPGNGPVSFALNVARKAAIDDKAKVAIFSLKNSAKSYIDFILRAQTEALHIDYNILVGKQKEEYIKVQKSSIYMENVTEKSIVELMEKACLMKKSHNIDLLVVDDLQLIQEPSIGVPQIGDRSYKDIVRYLKVLAMSLNLPILLISKLPKKVDKRSSKIPKLKDLDKYGSIENHLDKILFLHRPEYYGIMEDEFQEPTKNLLKIIVGKNHDGVPAQCYVSFSSGLAKISERTYEKETI